MMAKVEAACMMAKAVSRHSEDPLHDAAQEQCGKHTAPAFSTADKNVRQSICPCVSVCSHLFTN